MYEYSDIPRMQQAAENIDDTINGGPNRSDFWRVGVKVYVGSFPDVSGPDFVIDPKDEKGIEIFRSFCRQMADHYKGLENPGAGQG